ncbi:MAG: response regulator transcription factor [Salinivirgaceae bacterium]|jgi:DNA-binding NarL/FixJ family response regulator|nr:response regulator transcription factor [Salinivirgaceae bacterium]
MQEKLKIALVDDHEMFRSGIKLILSQHSNWEIVIEANNGEEFLNQLNYLIPDIVLLDISMPVLNGYDTAKRAIMQNPDLRIIVLSMLSDEDYYFKMIEAGAKGFILKNSGIDELTRAIEEVAIGNNYFAQDLLKKVVLKVNNNNIEQLLKLNEKEKQVLSLICNGHTNKEISDKMFLSIKTIEKYRHGLIQKTKTRNTAHLVMQAILTKLIEF